LDPAVEGKSYNCAQSRYLMYAGATDSSVDAVTPFDVAAERQIPRLRATRGNRYQVIVQISPKYRGAGGCDAFGCGLAWTLTFGLGEALANGSVEGGSCHTINCGLASALGLPLPAALWANTRLSLDLDQHSASLLHIDSEI
jgi:hypothetical protein